MHAFADGTDEALGPVVDAGHLAAEMESSRLRIIDFRWELQAGSRRDLYLEGHIPGAVFVDLESVTGRRGPGRHPLPSPESFAQAMREAGVNRGSRVVVYDTNGLSAARLWWLLQHFGHAAVAVLDGGLPAWVGPLEAGDVVVAPGDFESAPRRGDLVAFDRAGERRPGDVLIDARVGERYRGEVEPVDARPGHIPGSVNLAWSANLDSDGRFRDPLTLRRQYSDRGVRAGSDTIVYCGSGVSACVDLLALSVAGFGPGLLYEGSWSDWASRPELPVATGDDPGYPRQDARLPAS